MKKTLSLLALLSSAPTVATVTSTTNNKITFSINITSKEDVQEALLALEQIIPLMYQQEIAEDSYKQDLIERYKEYLEAIMSSGASDDIRALTNAVLKWHSKKSSSLTDMILDTAVMCAQMERVEFFTSLVGFLYSPAGQEVLSTLEECKSQSVVQLPYLLLIYYCLSAVEREIIADA